MAAVVLALLIVRLAIFELTPVVLSLSTLAMPLPAPTVVAVKVAAAVPCVPPDGLIAASAPEIAPLTALQATGRPSKRSTLAATFVFAEFVLTLAVREVVWLVTIVDEPEVVKTLK